jgi:uncharacterized membrane protein YccF (DUF307 family)
MNTIGNLVWLVFGGLILAIAYFISSLLLFFTIIGIPFGLQTMKIGLLVIWPFGRKPVFMEKASGFIALVMNILWLLLGGFYIAIAHLILGILLFITIIGIPFGKQHFKLATVSLIPFGQKVISVD